MKRGSFQIKSKQDLKMCFDLLRETEATGVRAIKDLLQSNTPIFDTLKFEAIGRHPMDNNHKLNIIEQINLQATYYVALKGVEHLMSCHPDKVWRLAPGSYSKGSDIQSLDGEVHAETFAAVRSNNNKKMKKDTDRLMQLQAKHKYIFYMIQSDFEEKEFNFPDDLKAVRIPRPKALLAEVI